MPGDSTTMMGDENSMAGGGDEQITLKVNLQDGNCLFFTMKRSRQLKKLMARFCDMKSLDLRTIAFVYDGRRLHPEHTPAQMEMQDGDVIDAMLHQTGGSTAAQ